MKEVGVDVKDFQENLDDYMKRACEHDEVFIILKDGVQDAVFMSRENYDKMNV